MSLLSKKSSFAVLFLTALCLIPATAQTTKVDHTASVGGRVMVNGQPAAGVVVVLRIGQRQDIRDDPLARATTDAEGHFQMSRLAAGSYRVNLIAPGYINASDENPYRSEQIVNVEENDTIDNLTFSLKHGGVITGTVTDAAHQPLIEASVRLGTVGPNGQVTFGYQYSSETDDRGVYRIFGLPAGRYKVSVTESSAQRVTSTTLYPATYYPNTREEAKAEIVEVPDGGEVTDIDIRVGEAPKTYAIYGRMIDAQTGKPMAGLRYGLGSIMPNESQSSSFRIDGNLTDAKGEFKIGGLVAGRYEIFAVNSVDSNVSSEPVIVDITDADAKVEVKTRNGASINGYVIVEGTNDAKILQQLSQYYLYFRNSAQRNMPGQTIRFEKPDRSFHMSGLLPGKVELNVGGMSNAFTLSRLEKDGVEVKSIEVREGEQVNNVNVYLNYNKGVIRGQVRVESGDFPDLSGLYVFATRKDDSSGRGYRQCNVDSRGRFVMEGIAPGEYTLSLRAVNRQSSEALARMQRLTPQTVTVTNDAESQVTIVLKAKE